MKAVLPIMLATPAMNWQTMYWRKRWSSVSTETNPCGRPLRRSGVSGSAAGFCSAWRSAGSVRTRRRNIWTTPTPPSTAAAG